MNVIEYSDFSASIRYALMSRPADDDAIEIVLDLYRGSAPASTTAIAKVATRDAGPVLARCQRHLERLGIHAVAPVSLDIAPGRGPGRDPDPRQALPLAAFDWMFGAG